MIYVILGMHKSGTTLVSQVLHRSGIDMGETDETVSYDTGNKSERQSTLALNLEILGARECEVLQRPAPARLELTADQRRRMRAIIRECSDRHADWGFKDPRTCLTYPLWAQELPPHRLIAVYRHPAEMWPRFRYGPRLCHHNPTRALLLVARWYEHNLRLMEALRDGGREHIVLSYAELMGAGEEFRRLERFVGRELKDARDGRLYRGRRRASPLLWLAERLLRHRYGATVSEILGRLDRYRLAGGSEAPAGARVGDPHAGPSPGRP